MRDEPLAPLDVMNPHPAKTRRSVCIAMACACSLSACRLAAPSGRTHDSPIQDGPHRDIRWGPSCPETHESQAAQGAPTPSVRQGVIVETRSAYSHIRVRDQATWRKLLFVRDTGEEDLESAIDLRMPDQLKVRYTETMFASLLFRPDHRSCLIVGLGGGSMVRFLNRFFPHIDIDVVEVDASVIAIARDYFGVTNGPKTRIIEADAINFLRLAGPRYDVIYMDAYLVPGPTTDAEGIPSELKGQEILQRIRERLSPDGLLAVNYAIHDTTTEDLKRLRSVFSRAYTFSVPEWDNLVAIALKNERPVPQGELEEAGKELDRCGAYGFSFAKLAARGGRAPRP